MKREFLEAFGIEKDKTARVSPSSDYSGRLEIKVSEGGPVYLFRGELDAEQAAAATDVNAPGNVGFDLAATVTEPGVITVEGGLGALTLFSRADSIGYVRLVTC
jgi:hypothetical protein